MGIAEIAAVCKARLLEIRRRTECATIEAGLTAKVGFYKGDGLGEVPGGEVYGAVEAGLSKVEVPRRVTFAQREVVSETGAEQREAAGKDRAFAA